MLKNFIVFIFLILNCIIYAEENVEYRISITNNLNLREKPDINSKVVMVNRADGKEKKQLHITECVKVLQIEEKEVIVNGNKGRWILVDTRSFDLLTKKQVIGWVFDYYLAKEEDFRFLQSLPNNLELDDEDSVFHYKFFKDGTAQYQFKEKIKSGKLYIDNRNRVVVIKYDDQKEFVIWSDAFIYEEGKICMFGGGEADGTKHLVGNACSKIVK